MLFKRIAVFSCLLAFGLPVFACDLDDPLYMEGVTLLGQKQYRSAIGIFQRVFEKNPQCFGAKLDLAESYFHLGEFTPSRQLFTEVMTTPGIPDGIRQSCEGFLRVMDDMDNQEAGQQATVMPPPPRLQVAVAMGGSDNANNGVDFDKLTFDSGILGGQTLTVTEEVKPKSGEWYDIEIATQHELPVLEGLEGTDTRGYATLTWRDNLQNDKFDLATVRGMLELKPGEWQQQLEPRLVLSVGEILLDGHHYREDIAIGGQFQPSIAERKVALGYQFTASDYKVESVGEMDTRSHRVSLNMPLLTVGASARLSLDAGYQWPETAERLADYSESSARLRLNLTPEGGRYAVSASYGLAKQHDDAAYNAKVFGDQKRNLKQQVLNIGLAWQADQHTTYEAKLQARQQDSVIPLFDSSAVDVTAGVRWQWD